MDLKQLVEQVSLSKGIKKDVVVKAVEDALSKVMAKKYPYGRIETHYDGETGTVEIYHFKQVVDSEPEMLDEESEINLPEARLLDPECKIGDELGVSITAELGRIDAGVAKQVMTDAITRAEHELAYQELKPQLLKAVSAVVQQVDVGGVLMTIGKTEVYMPRQEQISSEKLKRGQAVDVLLQSVETTKSGRLKATVSRKDPRLVMALFKEEVPEIEEGTIEMKMCAREAGVKAKLVVDTQDRINPVAVCIGTQGYRIQKVQHRLNGERVDVVSYTRNEQNMLINLFNRIKLSNITITDKLISAEVSKEDLPKAIGLRGVNIRLAEQVLKKKVEIKERTKESVVAPTASEA